jgi:hypothetical protein
MRKCGACWRTDDDPELTWGVLIDPNSHKWDICSESINALWHLEQPLDQDTELSESEWDTAKRVLAQLIDKLMSDDG